LSLSNREAWCHLSCNSHWLYLCYARSTDSATTSSKLTHAGIMSFSNFEGYLFCIIRCYCDHNGTFLRFALRLCVFVHVYHFIFSVSLAGAVLAPAVWGTVRVSEGGPVTGKILSVICTNMQFLTLK